MDSFGFLKVAAAVPHVRVGDCDFNAERMAAMADEAAQRGVEIVAFPELALTAYTCGDLLLQPALLDAADEALARLVRDTRKLPLTLIAGAPLRHGQTLYNCAVVFTQGRILGVVPKTYIPDYTEFYENRWFASGAGISEETIPVAGQAADFGTGLTFEVNGTEFGVEICEDLWTAVPPSSHMALSGAKVIFNLSASPEAVGKHAYLRQLVAQQSARTIGGYVYCSAGFGESSTDLVFAGNGIIAENGKILREAKRFVLEEQLVVADLDIERLEFERLRNTSFRVNEGAAENTVIEMEIPEGLRAAALDRDIDPMPFVPQDEAHRSQYGIFADNMMKLLPTAARIGFTGTPLLSSDNITARTFGGYVSIYDFKRAVEDGATVPLYYENRGEKILDLHNPEITNRILDAIENADLDVDQQDKLESEFAKEIHLLTAEPRLRSIAKDFAGHYSDLWTSGKAMFVCLNKVTCVRMYNFVQEYWQAEIQNLKAKIKSATQQEAQELERKLRWMQETEMAVVISQEQNEIQTFRKWGLDIKTHREKMENRELDKEFKDSGNPLRVVFVCAMWLTGFDVKCLSCLYLDKPLKAHTLMQTIARANRVAEGKSNGLIIDYIGIVKALRKALADYTANAGGLGGADPTVDKEKLIARIGDTVAKTETFLSERKIDLGLLIAAEGFAKLSYLQDAANAVCGSVEDKKSFSTYASELKRLMKYTDRDDVTGHMRRQCEAIAAIYGMLQKKRKHTDTTDLMVEINAIINDYVEIEPQQPNAITAPPRFDISAIDFDLLRREFAKTRRKNLLMRDLDEAIRRQLDKMVFANPKRIDYYERYREIIQSYNGEQDRATIEKTFLDLMDLADRMSREEQRYAREGFASDEELSLYDMLFRDDLSKNDIKKLKTAASDLLRKIKTKISELDHWTDKQETRAVVDTLIRDVLWETLPECYNNDDITEYREKVYEYVFTRYKEIA